MNKIERIKELVKLCNYHNNLYYTKDKPEISDKEYDLLQNELESLEKETGYILASSSTQKVQGEVLPELIKVQHSEPMLSAEKSKDINDVLKFMGNKECVLSWKLDGLTLVLKYNNGKFLQAITRGSGYEGEDVSHSVRTFTNVPLTIDYKGYLELRGEGLVLLSELEKVNAELIAKGEEPYSNCRNLASGSVRQLNSQITKSRNMIFIAFGIVKCEGELWNSKYAQLAWLSDQGFEVVYHEMVNNTTVEKWINIFQGMIPNLSYLTDGLIIEFEDIAYGKAQGFTGHHTKNLFAKKWQDDSSETPFIGVELNTRRTGMTSITGLFQEVDIDGVKVSRASLHNYDIFESLQLGVGDIVSVYRANAVIPQIEDNLTRSGTYKIDMHCPSCGSDLVIKRPKEARFLFCENENCPSRLVDKFVHFVSKDAMNIDGLSDAGIEMFLYKDWIKTFADLYRIDRYKTDIIRTEGFGVRSYEKLSQAIEKSKSVKFENFVYALGIPQIGTGGSKRLAKHFKNNINAFLTATKSHHNFTSISDFGLITAYSVYEYFSDESNMNQVKELLKYVNILQDKPKEIAKTGSPFANKKVYCTGTFASYKKEELQKILEGLGAEFGSGYAKSLDYLIVGSLKGSGKEDRAKKDGVPILSEDEFLKMIGEV
jgi:DNA ligase (NAD+)